MTTELERLNGELEAGADEMEYKSYAIAINDLEPESRGWEYVVAQDQSTFNSLEAVMAHIDGLAQQ